MSNVLLSHIALFVGDQVRLSITLFVLAFTLLTTNEVLKHYNTEMLAKSLTKAGWTLYANMQRCFFCKLQRDYFRESARFLDIVNCDEDRTGTCLPAECNHATPCWYNSETKNVILGFQRDRSRLWRAAETKA